MKAASGRKRASGPAIRVHGHLDEVDPSGTVSGWCAEVEPPFTERRVSVLVDGVAVVQGIPCTIFRRDLLEAGIGDGNHGFKADIPPAAIAGADEAAVSLLDETTDLPVGAAVHVRWLPQARPEPLLEAHVDDVAPDGTIAGWCWDRAVPERRVTLDILADGVLAGTALADLYRDDLRDAGKGSGHCGFGFAVPWQSIAGQGDAAIALQDHETGLPIGEPRILHRPQHLPQNLPDEVDAGQRIDALEREVQLLRHAVQALESRPAPNEDDRAGPALLRQVASLLGDLAEGRPPSSQGSLRARLNEVTAQFKLIGFDLPANPVATIYVLPAGNAERLYACLSALHRSDGRAQARVVLLDLATHPQEEVVLLGAVTRNITVMRLLPGETLNDVLQATPTPYLALLPAHLIPSPHWLSELATALQEDATAAMACGALEDVADSAVTRRLSIDWRGYFIEAAADDGGEADAVDELGVLVRLDSLRAVGGLDAGYANLPAQIVDLCLRLRLAGYRIAYRPQALAGCAEAFPSLLEQTSAADLARLRESAGRVVARHDLG